MLQGLSTCPVGVVNGRPRGEGVRGRAAPDPRPGVVPLRHAPGTERLQHVLKVTVIFTKWFWKLARCFVTQCSELLNSHQNVLKCLEDICWELETIQSKYHTAIHNDIHEIFEILKEKKVFRYNEKHKECGGSNLVWWWSGAWWWWQCRWWALLPLATHHTCPQTLGYHQCLWRGRNSCYPTDSQVWTYMMREKVK